MNGPLFVEDNPRSTPGHILVDKNSQVVAHVSQSGAVKEILELERDRRDPDFTTEINRLISIFPSQLNRSQHYCDLGSFDGSTSPYQDSLHPIDRATGQLKNLRREIQALAVHQHLWGNSGYCSICGADGNA
jgi:hypothetical protein